jgi:hypothetical protein
MFFLNRNNSKESSMIGFVNIFKLLFFGLAIILVCRLSLLGYYLGLINISRQLAVIGFVILRE